MGLDFTKDLKVSSCCLRDKDLDINLGNQPDQKLTKEKIQKLLKDALVIKSEK
jgi:hypothetical protein